VRLFSFHLMPYPSLPDDYDGPAWITCPNAFFDPGLGTRIYNRYLDELVLADELGFDGVCVNEHHQNAYGLMPSPNLMASILARVTKRAKIAVVGKAGARVIEAANFFQGPLMTALKPDEIITEIRLPAWPAKRRFGFREFARRRGDFALAAAMLFYDEDGGTARNAHVGAIGVADRPLRLPAVEQVLNGNKIDEAVIAKAEAAASASVDPHDDIHAGGAYRKALIGVMVERALKSAVA